jgi:hypothetical protein
VRAIRDDQMGIGSNRPTAVVASAFGMMDVVFILEAGTVVTPPAADTSDCGLRWSACSPSSSVSLAISGLNTGLARRRPSPTAPS